MNPLWNSLEVAKLLASITMPVALGLFGWWLNTRLKHLDQNHWKERSLIERRYKVYDEIARDLNDILCFFVFFGNWKEISPAQVISAKRRVDKIVNLNKYILPESFIEAKESFFNKCFLTNSGRGADARLMTTIESSWGNRTQHSRYPWLDEYNDMFAGKSTERHAVIKDYEAMMLKFHD